MDDDVRTRRLTRALVAAVVCLSLTSLTAPAVAQPAEPHPSDTSMDPIPRQYPFVCTVARHGLGQPKVDNQDRQGIPVAREDSAGNYPKDDRGYPTADAEIVGWSRDCEVDPVFEYRYRSTDGSIKALDAPNAPLPADIATVTTTEGRTAPYVIRLERGTINRYIYSIAMLAPVTETDPQEPDDSLWNGRLLYRFDGGVAIGRTQGGLSDSSSMDDIGLSKGYAVIASSGTRTSTHYNLTVGGQTAVMTKQHFVDTHGEPAYTVGVGGSGGAIQQYVYAQNHPGLLDGGVPQYSYPDMITQAIHVGDCELLEHYFERTDGDNPRWRDVEERQKVVGLNSERVPANLSAGEIEQWNLIYGALYPAIGATPPDRAAGAPTVGLTECRPAWFGLTPLVLNPHFTNVSSIDKLAEGTEDVEWTHAADAVNVYGTDESGFARVPWDNVGVQYGLEALASGAITPEEFLELNAKVGSWKESKDMVPEGCPFDRSKCTNPADMDPWSSRQMKLSPDGSSPAPRRSGDRLAIERAYAKGLVFRGAADIPFIDWRHYLEHELDMHNSTQSFAARQRMLDEQGHHDNQVIWFTDARPERQFDQTPMALEVLHEWITNIKDNPGAGVGGNRPARAVDSCFNTDGSLIAAGNDVWSGVIDDAAAGPCTERFPTYSSSRRVAGAPNTGIVFKCQTRPVRAAVADGAYGSWQPTAADIARLEAIFPTGVCDYDEGDVGDPRNVAVRTPAERFAIRAYGQLLGRGPTNAERSGTAKALDEGRSRPSFVAEMAGSPEHTRRIVTEVYQQVLGRAPEPGGLEYWTGRLQAGDSRTTLVVALAASGEKYAASGSTPAGYVAALYAAILGRPVDAGAEDYWVSRLSRDMSRSDLALNLYGSTESRRLRVTRAYQAILGRQPEAGGLQYWSDRLATSSDLAITTALMASSEAFWRP